MVFLFWVCLCLVMGPPDVQQGAHVFKRLRTPPKPPLLYYCEVCKISCVGPQPYKEHHEGQKHKKKEVGVKAGTSGPFTRGGNLLCCELCNVACTSSDDYAAHIRGLKHQKVVKLHTQLGKPTSSVYPVLMTKEAGILASPGGPTSDAPNPSAQAASTTPTGPPFPLVNGPTQSVANLARPAQPAVPGGLPGERDVQPVGHDFIEENKNEEGKVISFSCKLCKCRFNDPNAKEIHMKGRRHRLQYKKKVNPDLVVDIKPSLRQRKMLEMRAK